MEKTCGQEEDLCEFEKEDGDANTPTGCSQTSETRRPVREGVRDRGREGTDGHTGSHAQT